MYQTQVQFVVALLMLAEAGIVVLSGVLAWYLCLGFGYILPDIPRLQLIGLALFMVAACSFFMLKAGLYSGRRPSSLTESIAKIAIVVGLTLAVLGLVLYVSQNVFLPNQFLLSYALFLFCLLALNRALLDFTLFYLLRNRFHSRQVLVVGWDRKADILAKTLSCQRSWGHVLCGFLTPGENTASVIYGLPRLGSLADLDRILTERVVDDVFFILPKGDLPLREHLATCERHGVDYYIVPDLYDPGNTNQIRAGMIQGVPVLSKTMNYFNPSGHIYKRVLDYVGGVVGLLLFLLMYPLIGLAIRHGSPGPVLFKQTRVGRHGRLFTMYKFRTMYQDAELRKQDLLADNKMSGALFKLEHDPRVTRVGRFLRRTSLDEFPQFINVLRGEMSLVGPRPPTPDEVERYEPHHHRKLSVRPGITGLWQISGRNSLPGFDEALELDLAYIDHWHFRKDLFILLRTVFAVLRGDGAL